MSEYVSANHVVMFNSNVTFLSQQKTSRFASLVRNEALKGKKQSYDQLGPTTPTKRQGRHADTVLVNTQHDRRWVSGATWDWADMVDDIDKLKMLYDPTSPYAINAGMAFARLKDDLIIDAIFDTVYTGEEGLDAVTFPSSQVVPVNATNMTIDKLHIARELKESADVDEEEVWTIAVSPKQMTSLLKSTEIKSTDYNMVKALYQGEVDEFMGFKFKRSNRLLKDENGYTRCPAWCSSGVLLATAQEIKTTIGPRADKNNNIQIHCTSTLGAVRMEEVKAIEIVCTNA